MPLPAFPEWSPNRLILMSTKIKMSKTESETTKDFTSVKGGDSSSRATYALSQTMCPTFLKSITYKLGKFRAKAATFRYETTTISRVKVQPPPDNKHKLPSTDSTSWSVYRAHSPDSFLLINTIFIPNSCLSKTWTVLDWRHHRHKRSTPKSLPRDVPLSPSPDTTGTDKTNASWTTEDTDPRWTAGSVWDYWVCDVWGERWDTASSSRRSSHIWSPLF